MRSPCLKGQDISRMWPIKYVSDIYCTVHDVPSNNVDLLLVYNVIRYLLEVYSGIVVPV